MSDVGTNLNVDRGNWKFDSNIVDNFQEHIKNSVPLYSEGHEMICMLSDYFCENGSYVYDIGCSRGELIKKLAAYSNLSLNIIGIESDDSFASAASNEVSSEIKEKDLSHKPLLALIEQAEIKISHASQIITAVAADNKLSDLLQIKIGSPALEVTRIVYDTDEAPVQYIKIFYRPDKYQLQMRLSRVSGKKSNFWQSDS